VCAPATVSLKSQFLRLCEASHNRKNVLSAGSDTGGQRAAALYTLLGTARLNDTENPAHRRNRRKARIRSRVEHPFHTIKRVFGFGYTRLKGMVKNTNRLYVTCAMANLHRLRDRLAT